MSETYQRAIKSASVGELLAGHLKLRGRRNIAIVFGLLVWVAFLWIGWPLVAGAALAISWLGASGQQFHIKLIEHELKQRTASPELRDAPRGFLRRFGAELTSVFCFRRNEWDDSDGETLKSFFTLYEFVLPTIQELSCPNPTDANSIPPLQTLIECTPKLILARDVLRTMPCPKGKALRNAKKDLGLMLSSCIYACDWALKLALDTTRRGAFAGMVSHLTVVKEMFKVVQQHVATLRGNKRQ